MNILNWNKDKLSVLTYEYNSDDVITTSPRLKLFYKLSGNSNIYEDLTLDNFIMGPGYENKLKTTKDGILIGGVLLRTDNPNNAIDDIYRATAQQFVKHATPIIIDPKIRRPVVCVDKAITKVRELSSSYKNIYPYIERIRNGDDCLEELVDLIEHYRYMSFSIGEDEKILNIKVTSDTALLVNCKLYITQGIAEINTYDGDRGFYFKSSLKDLNNKLALFVEQTILFLQSHDKNATLYYFNNIKSRVVYSLDIILPEDRSMLSEELDSAYSRVFGVLYWYIRDGFYSSDK